MMEGRLPASPIGQLAGLEAVRAGLGDVVYRCVPDASFLNPMGVVHGGLLCTLLDAAAGSAVHTTLEPGVGFTSIEIKVNYLRAVRPGDVLTAHGWVSKPGRRVVFAEADVRDADDRLVANATTTCL
nr:PaaI family thioesterase [Micromonospora sp. DSM 115978]